MRWPWFSAGRDAREDALREELEGHLRIAASERIARGEAPEDAALNARREFGNVALVREATRDAWGGQWHTDVAQDVRFGMRMLRRTPIASAIAVLCLALGIGANTAVFSWMEGILLRPYPGVAAQDRLVAVAGTAKGDPGYTDMSWPDFRDLSKSTTLFSSFIAAKIVGATLGNGDRAERVVGLLVSPNYFQALGVRPLLGRGFDPREDVARDAHPEVVISYRMWRERFAGDPAVIGKALAFNGVTLTVVGVTPEAFMGTFVGYAMQFWAPESMQEVFDTGGYQLDDRGSRWIEGLARLAPGVSIDQAQAALSSSAKRLASDFPNDDRGRGVRLLPLYQAPFDNAKELLPMLRVAFVVVVAVLLIACANVANLLLVRAFSRRQEMTVRMALGAARTRLLRQLVTEGVVLAVIATLVGLLMAFWWRHVLVLFFAPRGGVSLNFATPFDWRVLALTSALGLGSTLVFALVPAVRSSNIDVAGALRSDSRNASGGRGRSRMRSSLVASQVALSFILLVGAGLLLASLQRIRNALPGFSKDGVLVSTVNLFSSGYDSPRAKIFADRLLDRVRAGPGVQSAALARSVPFSPRPYDTAPISVDGYDAGRDEQPTADYNAVSPQYFTTMGIPLIRGRDFSAADVDTAGQVAIVSETMASRYWPNSDPVGRRLQANGKWMRIIGIAGDVRYQSLLQAPKPLFYLPLAQSGATAFGVFIRTTSQPRTIAPILIADIHALDPNLAPYEVLSMREQVDRSTSSQQIAVTLLGVFGLLALLLAMLGLYGVMSYAVMQSTRELGLRMALGAAPATLLRLVLTRGFALTGAGLLVGLALALGTTRLLGDLLFGISPRDPTAFASAFALMVLMSLLACLLPALRAARTDPARALRA